MARVDSTTEHKQVDIPEPEMVVSNIEPTEFGSVLKTGELSSPNFRVGRSGWRLQSDGTAEFVNGIFNGEITANSGTIGGWTVGSTTLVGGSVTLDSTGKIIAGTVGGQRVEISANSMKGYQVGDVKRWALSNDTLALYDASEVEQITIRAGVFNIGTLASIINQNIHGAIIPGASGGGLYNLGASGNRWATVYCVTLDETSDETLKSDIKDEISLAKLKLLKPKKYTLFGKKRHGFLAGELKQVIPELVTDTTEPGAMGINYTGLVGPLVSAVQELATRVELLEAEVAKLKK